MWLLFKGYYLYWNMSLTEGQKLTLNASVKLKSFLVSFYLSMGIFFGWFFFACHFYPEQWKCWSPEPQVKWNIFPFHNTPAVHGALQASGERKAITGKVTEDAPVWWLDGGEWEGKGRPLQTESQGKGILFLPSPWAAAHPSRPASPCLQRQQKHCVSIIEGLWRHRWRATE